MGGKKIVKVDARLISTSNRTLKSEVENGNFREDLFYRIHVIVITLPPLRERKEDIPAIAETFLKTFAPEFGRPELYLSEAAIEALKEMQQLIDETGAIVYQPFLHECRAAFAEAFECEWSVDAELRVAKRLFTDLGADGHVKRIAGVPRA